MSIKLNSLLGLYYPSFFRMHISTDETLDQVLELSDNALTTFIHEYIHFLQDVSTYFGLMNMIVTVDFVKYCARRIHLSKQSKFKVPFTIPSNDIYNINLNKSLTRVYFGNHSAPGYRSHGQIQVEEQDSSYNHPDDLINQIKKVVISNGTQEVEFGAICIMESMANIAIKTSHNNLILPDFPYETAEDVVNLLYPEFSANLLNVFALCDCALFSHHPGHFFYSMLQLMKVQKWMPSDPRQIYLYCDQNISTSSLDRFYLDTLEIAKSQLRDYFTAPSWTPMRNWCDAILDGARNLRARNRTFMLDFVAQGDYRNNRELHKMFEYLGYPLSTNNMGHAFILAPSVISITPNVDLLWAINQIYEIFAGSRKSCELEQYCRESCNYQGIPDYTDARCASPWLRTNDSTLCAFAQVWNTWGLKDKELKV